MTLLLELNRVYYYCFLMVILLVYTTNTCKKFYNARKGHVTLICKHVSCVHLNTYRLLLHTLPPTML